jgi:hypothetical protein
MPPATGVILLIAINQASLLIAPCKDLTDSQRQNNEENKSSYYKCSAKDGIIAQGILRLSEVPPEWWTTVFSGLLALFTWTLWRAN